MKKIVNGVEVEMTREEIQQREAEEAIDAARIAEYKAKEYQRKRANEYPPIPEQLDIIFHDGIDAWKEVIQAVKDKYPKPEVK